MNKQNVRTGSGTIHALTIGRTYVLYGRPETNVAGSVMGAADCGARTSAAATITDDPVTCAKCAARA